jgi:hypothetical protein
MVMEAVVVVEDEEGNILEAGEEVKKAAAEVGDQDIRKIRMEEVSAEVDRIVQYRRVVVTTEMSWFRPKTSGAFTTINTTTRFDFPKKMVVIRTLFLTKKLIMTQISERRGTTIKRYRLQP